MGTLHFFKRCCSHSLNCFYDQLIDCKVQFEKLHPREWGWPLLIAHLIHSGDLRTSPSEDTFQGLNNEVYHQFNTTMGWHP